MTWVGIGKGLVRWVLRIVRSGVVYPLLRRLSSARWVGNWLRVRALRTGGISIGERVRVGSNVELEADNVVLGSDSVVGDNVAFHGLAHIHVSPNSILRAHSSIGDVRVTGGSGLAIHYPVTATGEAGHGAN